MNTPRSSADEPTTEFQIGRAVPWAACLAALLALAVLGVLGKIPLPWQKLSAEQQAESLREKVEANNQFAKLADRAQAKAAWRKLQAGLSKTLSQFKPAAKQLAALEAKLAELETSELGRRVASSPARVTSFSAIQQASRPSAEALEQAADSAEDYLGVADTALIDDSVIVGPEQTIADACRALNEELAKSLAVIQEQAASLDALTTAVRDAQPAEITLAEAVRLQLEERSAAQLAEITRERERIQEVARVKQLENEKFTEQAVQNAETERLAAQQRLRAAEARATAERERRFVEEAEAKIAAARAHAEKLRKFEAALPEIKELLAPMITPGRMQLGRNGWTPGEQGPVSLAALEGAKALDLTENGRITLGSIFCGPLCRNDRPRGAFPESMTTNEVTLRRAQELLVQFGEILVEKEMLNP